MLGELEELRELLALGRFHLTEDLARAVRGQLGEQVGGRVGIHHVDDLGGAVAVEGLDDRHLDLRVDLLERVRRHFIVERLEHGLALGGREVLDDVGDVGRVEAREAAVRDLELHAARRIRFEQIDELPRDHARRNPVEERAEREGRDQAPGEAPDRAARADVDRDDVQHDVAVHGRRVDVDVVHAHDLAAVDVDDLLVEQVALEEQGAVRRRVDRPGRQVGGGADARAAEAAHDAARHGAVVPPRAAGADDQERDAGGVVLGRNGDLAHASPDDAGGVAHGCAEQFGECDERHWPM